MKSNDTKSLVDSSEEEENAMRITRMKSMMTNKQSVATKKLLRQDLLREKQ